MVHSCFYSFFWFFKATKSILFFHRVKLRIKTDSKQFELKEEDEEGMVEEDAAAANDDEATVVNNTGLDHDEESQDMVRAGLSTLTH